MKNVKVKSKKTVKATKAHYMAGVPVRSGVKAGRGFYNPPGPVGGPGGDDPGFRELRNR